MNVPVWTEVDDALLAVIAAHGVPAVAVVATFLRGMSPTAALVNGDLGIDCIQAAKIITVELARINSIYDAREVQP